MVLKRTSTHAKHSTNKKRKEKEYQKPTVSRPEAC